MLAVHYTIVRWRFRLTDMVEHDDDVAAADFHGCIVHFNLQTGRPVCMSFTLEGRGKHCTHPQQRQPKEGKASLHFLHFRRSRRSLLNYGVVLLLGVESLTVGSTTGVSWSLMSPGPVYVNCGVVLLSVPVLKYYTTEASEYYTTIYAAARCITKEPEYYITHPQQRPICMPFTLEGRGDHYENLSKRWFNSGAVLLFGVVSLKVGSTTGLLMSSGHGGDQATAAKEYYTTPPPYYATNYATNYADPSHITKAPEYYITEALQLRRRTQAYNTAATPSYYVELKNYTKAAVNYTITYATPSYYDEAPNYYTEEATCYTSTYSAPVTTPRNPSITPLQATTKLRLLFATPRPPSITIQPNVNYGVVLLLVVLSLIGGLTTGVPMSPGYGGYQTATPASYHTTYAATGYYTPKTLGYYTITNYVPNFYTEASKLNSAPS
ncbi:hypothetical protein DAPPUDRAFT_235345 [Daphnia pulex]|uniref:Uncharacterized protein n=1 Tax=Daphnia pulex TaxID=6669 RepID=E9FYS8_DAPPU|nr:hypothetical protein DAPPUDRAFT_235345 [Daphnia pulex]|eukprot:EFX87722.1 hypothetical protein DAPPUDRAFT_235345 [Daphnia pulex]